MELFFILIVSVSASLLSVAQVIYAALKTPVDHLFLWTGHYSSDYFVYLQVMVQGARGEWWVKNLMATDDPSRTWLVWWPDLILGKMAGFLGMEVMMGYWLAVVILGFILAFLIFWCFKKLLKKKPFHLQFSAFLLTLLAAPFFKIEKSEMVPFDYWRANSIIFNRFPQVPHHLLEQVLTLVIFLLLARFFSQFRKISFSEIIKEGFLIGILTSVLLSFSFLGILVVTSLGLTILVLFLQTYLSKKGQFKKLLFFSGVVFSLALPAALAVKFFSSQFGPIERGSSWEAANLYFPPAPFILLATGPILFFVPFGIRNYFRFLTPIKWLVFFLFLTSWLFYFSSLPSWMGIASWRFSTPLVYLFWGALAALGLEQLSRFFRLKRQKLFVLICLMVFLLYFIGPYFLFFQRRMNDPNLYGYLHSEVVEGLIFLKNHPASGAVLVIFGRFFGPMLPSFAYRRVYSAHSLWTPGYEAKNYKGVLLYTGQLNLTEAQKWLVESEIKFVALRLWDSSYSTQAMLKYDFLKIIYQNDQVVIFEVK